MGSGSGREQELAACNTIQEWGLQGNMSAIVFHTTTVNTGRISGTLMRNLLQKSIVLLAYGNYEIIWRRVFE